MKVDEYINNSIRSVFDDAIDIFSTPGAWLQGRWDNGKRTAFCVLGGLKEAYRRKGVTCWDDRSPATRVLRETLDQSGITCSIPSWNDMDGRTQEEVVEMLKTARERVSDDQSK